MSLTMQPREHVEFCVQKRGTVKQLFSYRLSFPAKPAADNIGRIEDHAGSQKKREKFSDST